MGTFYYYCKISNKDKYYKYRSEEVEEHFFTEDKFAEIFYNENFNNLVFKDEMLYIFHKNLWYEDRKLNKLKYFIGKYLTEYLSELGIQILKKIMDIQKSENPNNSMITTLNNNQKLINKNLASIQTATKKKNIAECVIHHLSVRNFDDIEFDHNGYILPFNSNVYDLQKHKFRKAKKEDYILTVIPYEIEERDEDKINLLDDLFNKIFPDREIKENYFSFLVTAMYGQHIEKFIIANGGGGNGKGLINELFEEMMSSNFCYRCSNAVLLQPLKEGINTQVANMNNKRCIFYSEPDSTTKKINGATMKELTGGKGISAERKYSMNNKVYLKATHFLEANNKPKIDGRIDDSYLRRLVDIPFKSTFTNNHILLNDKDRINTYKANSIYKTDEFKNEYKHQLFYYLMDHSKNYKSKYDVECIEKIYLCDEVNKRTKNYLEHSDEKYTWFINNFQKTEGNILKIKDVFDNYKTSDLYNNMSKKEKREESYNNFIQFIKDNVNFRSYYRERHRETNKRNVLIGWKLNPIENENETDDEGLN